MEIKTGERKKNGERIWPRSPFLGERLEKGERKGEPIDCAKSPKYGDRNRSPWATKISRPGPQLNINYTPLQKFLCNWHS